MKLLTNMSGNISWTEDSVKLQKHRNKRRIRNGMQKKSRKINRKK